MRRHLLPAPAALSLAFAFDVALALPMCVPDEAVLGGATGSPIDAPTVSTSPLWEPATSQPARTVFAVDGSRGMAGYKRRPARTAAGAPSLFRPVLTAAVSSLEQMSGGALPEMLYFRGKTGKLRKDPTTTLADDLMPCTTGLGASTKHTTLCPPFTSHADIEDFLANLWTESDLLSLGPDDLVVVATDLQNETDEIGAGAIGEVLRTHLSDADKAILLTPFKSRFSGWVFDLPGQGAKAHRLDDGVQPFYLLALGRKDLVARFRDELQAQLAARSVSMPELSNPDYVETPLLFTQQLPAAAAALERSSLATAAEYVKPIESIELLRPAPDSEPTGAPTVRGAPHAEAFEVKLPRAPRAKMVAQDRQSQPGTDDASSGAGATSRLVSLTLGTLPGTPAVGLKQRCLRFIGEPGFVCPRHGAAKASRSSADGGAVRTETWLAQEHVPTPGQVFRSALDRLRGREQRCTSHGWQPLSPSQANVRVNVNVGQSAGQDAALQLTAEIDAPGLERFHANQILLTRIDIGVEARIEAPAPTWVTDDERGWYLTPYDTRSKVEEVSAGKGTSRSFGTGGLKQLVTKLNEAVSASSGETSAPVRLTRWYVFELTR